VAGPRRSEDAPVVSGEAIKPAHADEGRVDAPGRIVVTPMPGSPRPVPIRTPSEPARRGGLWLVVLVYLLSASALGYAIWERFLR